MNSFTKFYDIIITKYTKISRKELVRELKNNE